MSGGDLVPRGEDSFGVPGLRTGPTGVIDWPTHMTFPEWDDLGVVVCEARDWTAWMGGDWFLFGEERWKEGDKYAQAQAITGRSYGGLRNLRWVAHRFPLHRRRETLTWSHHRAVAGIKDDAVQDEWLDRAEAGWSVDLLESSLRDAGIVSSHDDSTRMERELRDAPLEQVEHAIAQLPAERRKAIAAVAQHERELEPVPTPRSGVDCVRLRRLAKLILGREAEWVGSSLTPPTMERLRRALGEETS